MLNQLCGWILFSVIGQLLPLAVRYWAYDYRYNRWANCPVWGDLAQARKMPGFNMVEFELSRQIERDCSALSLEAFKAKWWRNGQLLLAHHMPTGKGE